MTKFHTAGDPFNNYLNAVSARFAKNTKDRKTMLFTTAITGSKELFDTYLDGFPEGRERQHHNCNACRKFINTVGTLVTIDEKGRPTSAVWNLDDLSVAPPEYHQPIRNVLDLLAIASVTGVYIHHERTWGTPKDEWTHFAVTAPVQALAADGAAANIKSQGLRQDFGILKQSVQEFSLDVVNAALNLIRSGATYRGDAVEEKLVWFADLLGTLQGKGATEQENLMWRAAAGAPFQYAQVRARVAGSLLKDLKDGDTPQAAGAKFKAKMASGVYMTSTVAPSAGNIRAAEKTIQDMGLEPALRRRGASSADLPDHAVMWQPRAARGAAKKAEAGGVFSKVKSKTDVVAPSTLPAGSNALAMTWEKFTRTVLADAISISARVPAQDDRFMALVTAVDPEAPPLLKWDTQDNRNPVSWYYAGGVDGEMARRVTSAGGQYHDVDLRVSLMWHNRNDLDVHVFCPDRTHIYYGNKRPGRGAGLTPRDGQDVDMNISGESETPVENIRWEKRPGHEHRLNGKYTVGVSNYNQHAKNAANVFTLELEAFGQRVTVEGELPKCANRNETTFIAFELRDGKLLPGSLRLFSNARLVTGAVAVGQTNSWGLPVGEFAKVTHIVNSPDTWGNEKVPGYHTFFLLEGAADSAEGRGRGFFAEHLRGELHGVRSTLNAFCADQLIEAPETGAPLAGLGFSPQRDWGVELLVETSTGPRHIMIDRQD